MALPFELIPVDGGRSLIIVRGANETGTQPLERIDLPITAFEIKVEPAPEMKNLLRKARTELRSGKCHCGSGVDARFCGCHKPARRNAREH